MKIIVKAPEKKVRGKKGKKGKTRKATLRLPEADTALEFRLNTISGISFSRVYTLEIVDNEGQHVEIICTDGRRKKHRLQFFNLKRNISCCSCEEFVTDECRFCVHLAAVENVLRFPKFYKEANPNLSRWAATFRGKLLRIPTSVKKFTQHYTFFDPYSTKYYTFGSKKPTIETVSTKTIKRLQRKKKIQKVKYLPKRLSDEGLLAGVTLYPYQKDVFKNMLRAQRAICSMIMGSGKAEPLTARLLTPNGWTTMGQIKVGDLVIGSNGQPITVTGVFPQGKKKIYKVTFTDNSSVECCAEHLWAIRTPQQKYRGNGYKVKPLSDFMDNLVDKQGNHKFHIPMVDTITFLPKPIELDPYVLGLLLGDGGFSNKKAIYFSSVDSYIVEQLETRLPCDSLSLKKKKDSEKDYRITKKIANNKPNKLLEIVRSLNLSGKKSECKHVPFVYKYNSPKIRLRLLQGLMDTDGFVSKNGHSVIFYSASKQLIEDVQELVWSFGGKAVVCDKQTYYLYENKKRKGLPSYALQISLPSHIVPFTLPRKLQRFKPRTKYQPTRYVKKVEYIGKKEAQCISVNAEDHLYVTDDYIVTHNTLTTIACYSFIDKHKPGGGASMLVIAPKSLRRQWGTEIERTCHVPVFQIEKPAHIEKSEDENINVVTYQFLTRHIDKFAKRNWDVVVVDEIQYVRNSATKTWKAISRLKSDFFFGLSGTVIENRLDDLYSIMEIIQPDILPPKWKFDDQFQELQIKSRSKWIYKGFQNLDQLKELLKDCVFSYDKLKLPSVTYHDLFVQPTKQQSNAHDGFYEEAKRLIAKSLNGNVSQQERMMVQALLLKSRQTSNTLELISKKPQKPSTKILKYLDLVEEICIKNNEKLVVFSEWVEMLEICARFTKKKFGIDPLYFTGRQNLSQRQDALKKFQNDPSCSIFYASDAGGVGLDGLQLAAANMVHLELPWNPAKLDQRSARLHRIGQKNSVNIYHVITEGTIEKHIHSLVQEKKNIRVQTLAEFHV